MRSWHSLALLLLLAACGRSHGPEEAEGDAGPGGRDSGPGALDIGLPLDAGSAGCAELGAVDCLGTPGCVATYDDACCPSCRDVGFCADCFDPDFWVCRPYEDACAAAFCSFTAPGACEGEPLDCTDAIPMDDQTCTLAGCVPATGMLPDPGEPYCVPLTGGACSAFCRLFPGECPEGFRPEGDGSCYTGRCIAESHCPP